MNEDTYEDFGPDDDTEELPPREVRKAYERARLQEGDYDFPDLELFVNSPDPNYDDS